MKTVRMLLLFSAACLLWGACASVDNTARYGALDTPQHLWWDDLAFENSVDDIPPDWAILDIGSESFSNVDENWSAMQSDAFDIIK